MTYERRQQIKTEIAAWGLLLLAVFGGAWAYGKLVPTPPPRPPEGLQEVILPNVNAVGPAITPVPLPLRPDPTRPGGEVVSDPDAPQHIVFADGSPDLWFGTASWYDYSFYYDPVCRCTRPDGYVCNRTKEDCYTEDKLFAASRDYPRGTELLVTNLASGREVVVTVTDYGPEEAAHPGRIIDLTSYAFAQIADIGEGLIEVSVQEAPADYWPSADGGGHVIEE
jgi:hypothetical protein